jgi:hypothetical protein
MVIASLRAVSMFTCPSAPLYWITADTIAKACTGHQENGRKKEVSLKVAVWLL